MPSSLHINIYADIKINTNNLSTFLILSILLYSNIHKK